MKKIPSCEDLINRFINGIEKTKNIDYADKNSVKRNNQGVDEYRKAAKQFSELYPEQIEDFAILLKSDDIKTRQCAAICMVELMNCSVEQRSRAFDVVKEYYKLHADSIERMMIKEWLKEHEFGIL